MWIFYTLYRMFFGMVCAWRKPLAIIVPTITLEFINYSSLIPGDLETLEIINDKILTIRISSLEGTHESRLMRGC